MQFDHKLVSSQQSIDNLIHFKTKQWLLVKDIVEY